MQYLFSWHRLGLLLPLLALATRKIAPTGEVSTLADGLGAAARFYRRPA
jgi:hypothetical protein